MSDTLAQVAADLAYAAGPGSARLASGVVAAGKAQAEVGAAMRKSGPGLSQLLRHSHSASAQLDDSVLPLGQVANSMAESLAQGGAELAVGKRR